MKRTVVGWMLVGVVTALGLLGAPGQAEAQQLVYRPTNPAFGGNPLNQQWLLSTAEAQRPDEPRDLFQRNPLDDFQSGLQRQILSSLSRELIVNRFGENLDLTEESRFDLGEFVVEVLPGLNGVDIRVINAFTGEQTTVTIPNF
jgi:curli production assembly/transport component CsgF